MVDLSEQHVAANPDRYPERLRGLSQYDLPFLFHSRPRSALMVGAGSGNDAAGALRHGVERITAVEIDPAIIELGKRYHPEKPYSSPRVKLVNDDARSFFATSHDRFDVIVFGLLDSHTTTAMTNARLDHYVYTRESLTHARSLLADGGVDGSELRSPETVRRRPDGQRAARSLRRRAASFPGSSHALRLGRLDLCRRRSSGRGAANRGQSALAAQIQKWQAEEPVTLSGTTRIATDDWPYIYLDRPRIPLLYFLLTGLLMVLLIRGIAQTGARDVVAGWSRTHWHFFFLGAAFMLLEVQNISKAAVVLGNTWSVNAVIISGILAMVLLSNLIVARWPRVPSWPVYMGLCAALLGDLRSQSLTVRVSALCQQGVARRRPDQPADALQRHHLHPVVHSRRAQGPGAGANLIGALVGGLLQSVTFVTGIRALLLIVIALYLAALATRSKSMAMAQTGTPAKPGPASTRLVRERETQTA